MSNENIHINSAFRVHDQDFRASAVVKVVGGGVRQTELLKRA